MLQVLKSVAIGAALLVLTGCASHVGTWQLDTIDPADAKGHYQFVNVNLHEDGTYTAERNVDGKMETNRGTYTFGDGKLTFKNAEGKEVMYDARLIDMNNRMEVKSQSHGQTVTAVMKRG